MGVPAFQVKELIDQENIVVCSSNYALYGDLSNRVMRIIGHTMPQQEIYSIDECFVKVGNNEELEQIGKEVRQKVLRGTGIPISIGFAPTKTLAKITNHVAKKQEEYGGVFVLNDAQLTRSILKATPINDVWGIGRHNLQKMIDYNILNAEELTRRSTRWIKHNFTSTGLDTYYELKGVERIKLDPTTTMSIRRSRSFSTPISDKHELYTIMMEFADIVCTSLQKKGLLANTIILYLKTDRHNDKQKQYFPEARIKLDTPTNNLSDLAPVLKALLDRLYKPDCPFKKAGIIATEMENSGSRLSFYSEERLKEKEIQQLSKLFSEKYGREALFMAIRDPHILDGITRHNHKTQNFTTDIREILCIKPTR